LVDSFLIEEGRARVQAPCASWYWILFFSKLDAMCLGWLLLHIIVSIWARCDL